MSRRFLLVLAALPCLLLAAPARADGPAVAQVTYRVGGSVYVDAGVEQGLGAGDTLLVRRKGVVIARLVARDVAAHRAACDTLAGGGGVIVGDDVAWTAHAVPAAADSTTGAGPEAAPATGAAPGGAAAGATVQTVQPAPKPARATARSRPVRGRVGLSAWAVDGGGSQGSIQPAADVRLDARDALSGMDFALDVRGRGTYATGNSTLTTDEMNARVYRASFAFHDAARKREVMVGRQIASPIASVSLFDGALATVTGARWSGGLLAGTQPEPTRLKFSTDLVEAGAYVERHAKPGSVRRWTASIGGVMSSQDGQPNRDFLFVQGYYQDAKTSLWLTQEIDVARGWRQDYQPGRFQLTSTFASWRYQATRALDLRAGYDGRRDVALYRDRLTPETQFDDALRQGAWVGATARGGPGLRVDGDVRQNFEQSAGTNTSWSSALQWEGMRAYRPRARVRYAQSTTALLVSRLISGGLDASPGASSHVGLSGGVRTSTDRASGNEDRVPWWGLDADVAILRAWSIAGSFDRESSADGGVNQGYLGFAYRF